jgi:DNA-binding NtrC family response regulator
MKPISVLVVDHDEQMLGLVEHWLAEAGYDVVTCSNFEAARYLLATLPLDAVVTDLRLGAYNGLHLALRASQMASPAAVIVMSAYDDIVLRRDTATFGGRFMLKPLARESLLEELSEALSATAAA